MYGIEEVGELGGVSSSSSSVSTWRQGGVVARDTKPLRQPAAERRGMNEPEASCFSGRWLRVTVGPALGKLTRERKDEVEDTESIEDVRVRGLERGLKGLAVGEGGAGAMES